MQKRMLVAVVFAGAMSLLATTVGQSTPLNIATGFVGSTGADPLLAVEASRGAIIDRLTAEYAAARQAAGVGEDVFRATLAGLRADQLLAATLVGSFAELTAIVTQTANDGAALQRYVAVTPTSTLAMLPAADGYVVRAGDSLNVVKAADLTLGANMQLVGYFVASGGATVTMTTGTGSTAKDGSGSGANSWIGYTGGNNVESGSGSAVAAGTYNTASNTNASVFAGQSNVAGGVSSLVIGGFDNQALAIDSLVGAGAGNRATGARSVVVGGGYNLASGQWSFIGGGGRQSGSGVAGAAAQDHIASGNFSVIGGGQGNRATANFSTIVGGVQNTASGLQAFVGGGYLNVASALNGIVTGGYSNTASATGSFAAGGYYNTASGAYSAALGGYNNIASGTGSVAMGQFAMTQTAALVPVAHNGAFVYADGSSGIFRSTADNTFNVLASGGINLITAATNSSGEAIAAEGIFIDTQGMIECGAGIPSNYGPCLGVDTSNSRIIGNQASTMYFRTNSNFAWFIGGAHSATTNDPGPGGAVLATLTSAATTTAVTGTFRAQVFTATSDRNAKTDFVPSDAKSVLAKVAQMPISTWSYKNEKDAGIRHIGPMAQDFQALFSVGYDDKSIATVDADGVALAAIQGLNAKVDASQSEIDGLRAQVASQAAQMNRQSLAIEAQSTRLAEVEQDRAAQAIAIADLRQSLEVLLARSGPNGRVASAQ